MKQTKTFPKVAMDLFWIKSSWTLGFLGIMLVINVIRIIAAAIQGDEVDSFFNAVFVASNIYMFVIGVISMFFITHLVENGVTRKDYFTGTLLTSIGLSISIPIVSFGVSAFMNGIINNIEGFNFKKPDINSVILEVDSNIIGDIVQAFILTPHVDPQNNWFLAIAVFSLNIFIYFVLGWLISASFYRFNTAIGLAFILLAIFILMVQDTLIRNALHLPVLDQFSVLDSLSTGISLLGIMLLIIFSLWMIRLMTRRVRIKI